MEKPFSQACENNKSPILHVLKDFFADVENVLEIGSGTGQHSVHFAKHLTHLQWLCSDREVNHLGILQWHQEASLANLHAPLSLDLQYAWPVDSVNAIYTANTLHIISWPLVERFFQGVEKHLAHQGKLCIYGPFKYQGNYTSASNAEFDTFLKQQDANSAIRDFEAICQLAEQAGLMFVEDVQMPANNQLLLFKRQ